jgi:beta-glucosidase
MKKVLALVLALVMVLGLCGTAFAKFYTDAELEEFGLNGYTPNEVRNDAVSRAIALDSYILMKNDGNVLPIAKEGKIALFGNGSSGTIKGGSGSGIVNQRERDWIETAFKDAGYEVTTPQAYFDRVGRGNVATGFSGDREAVDVALTDEWLEAAAEADTAIYVLARTAGEGSDRRMDSGNGRWTLTAAERGNLEKIAATFENVIIVLNTYVTDITWLNEIDNIDSVLYIGYGGQKTGITTLQVLNGDVTPSGKTISTWAWDLNDYYSSQAGFSWMDGNQNTEFYSEGIYVGYRYFDTFGLEDEVAFPFGFGLSYTDFEIDVKDVSIDAEEVVVTVKVSNVGATYSGKEVVQVYFSAPDGTLEKPYQELAAFAKTDVLAPGEYQILTIKFATTDMSSYSEELAAYIMEPGEYYIRVGNSSRNTHIAATGVVRQQIITEQLSNQFALEDGAEEYLNELHKGNATPITYEGEAAEKRNAPKTVIEGIETVNNASPYDDETAITYLFAEDAENYTVRKGIRLTGRTNNGIIQNAQYNPPRNNQFRGHQETTYNEEIEIVPDLPEGMTKDSVKLTDVIQGKISLKQFVACLSVAEMARLVNAEGQGANNVGRIYDDEGNLLSYSHAMISNMARSTDDFFASRHIPALGFTDGPAGIRCDREGQNQMICPQIRQPGDEGGTHYWSTDGGITAPRNVNENTEGAVQYHMYPTAFPGAINTAQTWNTDMMYAMGEGVGLECREYNVASWLAPGINIHRNPLCGRNFEYFSEDPLLSGFCGGYITAGVQASDGVGVCLKHYFGNNQENSRNSENNVMTERTAREIYLMGYKIAIEIGQPMYMMTSYNANNGWYSGDNFDACTDMLRGEWNFNGMVMTDWGGGGSTPHIAVHAGNDMMTPGKNVSTIVNNYNVSEPTFNADGSIRNAGNFAVQAGGSVAKVVPTNVESEEFLPASVAQAVADEQARYDKIGDDATITWYGEYNYTNKIALGDIQKAAYHILNVMLYTQDMEILCDDLGIERPEQYDNFTDHYEGTGVDAANDTVEKSDVVNTGIIAETVTVDTVAEKSASVEVSYIGEVPITTARLTLDSALPIKDIESDYDFEYNPAENKIVVYDGGGEEISGVLFTINYEFDAVVADGEYPVDLGIIEVTNLEGMVIEAVAIDGAVIVDNNYPIGDVTQDGEVDNRDLIMIARYLVGLVEFNAKQKIAADYYTDGVINNTDLVFIARAIVAMA